MLPHRAVFFDPGGTLFRYGEVRGEFNRMPGELAALDTTPFWITSRECPLPHAERPEPLLPNIPGLLPVVNAG